METKKTTIQCPDGKILQGLLWGNNAAWICQCGELLGNCTSQNKEKEVRIVSCSNDKCHLTYGIVPGLNDSGNYYLGPVESVHLIDE